MVTAKMAICFDRFVAALMLAVVLIGEVDSQIRSPLVIAHRGGYELYPENTIASFQDALAIDADAIECDVWLTADQQSIVIHDETYGRTTNVVEVYGEDKRIGELTLLEAKVLFISGGNGWRPEYSGSMRIPTFREVVDLIRDRRTIIVVDLKDPRQRNHHNILEILQEADISWSRVIFGGGWNPAFTPTESKNLFWSIGKPMLPKRPGFTQNGIVFDGSYFLTVRDTVFTKTEFTFEFRLESVRNLDATQYIYELTNQRNLSQWSSGLRLLPPNQVQWAFWRSGGNIILNAAYAPSAPVLLRVTKTNDSAYIRANGMVLAKVRIPPDLPLAPASRLQIGADRNGNRRFNGVMNSVLLTSNEDTLASYEFASSGLRDQSGYRHDLRTMSFGPLPIDIVGIMVNEYDPERTRAYTEMGYENLVWTVYDPKLMLTLLKDPNVGAITTGSPRVLQTLISGLQSMPSNGKLEGFHIYQNYPNPFNQMTWVRYSLGNPGRFSLSIYDILGREVRILAEGEREAGNYNALWDGRNSMGQDVGAGAYFLQLKWQRGQVVRKTVVLR